jgi:hypothetical protein
MPPERLLGEHEQLHHCGAEDDEQQQADREDGSWSQDFSDGQGGQDGQDRGADRSKAGLLRVQTGRGLMVTGVMMPG